MMKAVLLNPRDDELLPQRKASFSLPAPWVTSIAHSTKVGDGAWQLLENHRSCNRRYTP